MSDIIQNLVATGRMSHGIARQWFAKLSDEHQAMLEKAENANQVSQLINRIENERKKSPYVPVLDSKPGRSPEASETD